MVCIVTRTVGCIWDTIGREMRSQRVSHLMPASIDGIDRFRELWLRVCQIGGNDNSH